VTKDGQLGASYDYDPNGNRSAVSRDGGLPVASSYDAQDRLTSSGQLEYDYTTVGDMESKTDTQANTTTSYDYDALGALTHVELPGGSELDYAIDPAKEPGPSPSSTPTRRSRPASSTRPNVPDYTVRGANSYRVVTDQLGSPRAVVNSDTGQVAQELDFDEFGRVTRDTNPGFQPSATQAGSTTKTPNSSASAPFAPGALLCTPITTTTTPSDSRCAPLDFALGLYKRSSLTRLHRRVSPVP